MKKIFVIIGIVILVILAVGVYFFMLKYPSVNEPVSSNLGNTPNQLDYNVNIQGYAFLPNITSVTLGSTVTWTNNDPVAHTITSDSGTELASSLIASGGSFIHKFDTKGIFDYHCSIHPMMKGEIVVN